MRPSAVEKIVKIGPHVLILGDSAAVLPHVKSKRYHACVTDPPYGISFMQRKWDDALPDVKVWQALLRTLRPGAHLLSFGHSKKGHHLACRIEEAGFEFRDTLMWQYAQGMPKGLNVGKALDGLAVSGRSDSIGLKAANAKRPAGSLRTGSKVKTNNGKSAYVGATDKHRSDSAINDNPLSDEAKRWDDWHTELKPAYEPVFLARRPLGKGKAVAANVLAYGTGALNIRETRISIQAEGEDPRLGGKGTWQAKPGRNGIIGKFKGATVASSTQGRFPCNVLHDGSMAVLAAYAAFGRKSSGKPSGKRKAENKVFGAYNNKSDLTGFGDSGSAARFFFCAKASGKDRNYGLKPGERNPHVTVKPIALMDWLVKLVTPEGGSVLDPFMGSGTTGVAAVLAGRRFVGIERDPVSFEVAIRRVRAAYESTLSPQIPKQKAKRHETHAQAA